MVHLYFPTTNNEAEYKTLVAGLDLAKAIRATTMVVYCNSQVVSSQVNDDFKCKGKRMNKYLEQVRKRVDNLQAKFVQIPKAENKQANHLTKAALAKHMLIPSNVLFFVQLSPLIHCDDVQELGSKSS